MRRLVMFGAALAVLLSGLVGGHTAGQDREGLRRTGARSYADTMVIRHVVREGENLTSNDDYDGPGGMIQHYFGRRRDGLIAEVRAYGDNWRSIRPWCNWPAETPRADRTPECPEEHQRFSIRRSIGRVILVPLRMIEREARRDWNLHELAPDERVSRRYAEIASRDSRMAAQLLTIAAAGAAITALGLLPAPEPDAEDADEEFAPEADPNGAESDFVAEGDGTRSADRPDPAAEALAAAEARIRVLDEEKALLIREAEEGARAHAEETTGLRRERDARWEPETAHAAISGTAVGGLILGLLVLGFGGMVRRFRVATTAFRTAYGGES